MEVDRIHITTYSPRPDGSYQGAGGGGIIMDVKYVHEPDPAWPSAMDAVYETSRKLKQDGHVCLRNESPWSSETPAEYRAWAHRVSGSEGDHDDARFCEAGWTPGAQRNQRRWS